MSDHPDMERVMELITKLIARIRNSNHTLFGALIRAGSLLDQPGGTYAPDKLAEMLLGESGIAPGKGTQRLQSLNRQIEAAIDLPHTFVSHDGRWSLSEPGVDLVRAVRHFGRAVHALEGVGQPYQDITIRCHEVHLHRFLAPAAAHIRAVVRERHQGTWAPSIRREPAEGLGSLSVYDDPLAPRTSIWIGGGTTPDRAARRPVLDIPLYTTSLCLFLDTELLRELWDAGYVEARRDADGRHEREHGQPIGSISPRRLKEAVATREIAISLPPESTFSRRRVDELLGSVTGYNTQYFTRPSGADALTWPGMNSRAAALLSDDYVPSGGAGSSRLHRILVGRTPRDPETMSVYAHVRIEEMGPLHCAWLLELVAYVRAAELGRVTGRAAERMRLELDDADKALRGRLTRLPSPWPPGGDVNDAA